MKYLLIWMVLLPLKLALGSDPNPAPDAVLTDMKRVADWQMVHPSKHDTKDWTQGVYYCGMMALYDVSQDQKYLDAMVDMGEKNQWKPGGRPFHADDFVVCQTYCALYQIKKDPVMISPTEAAIDFQIANPRTQGLESGKPHWQDRWAWCDALFMEPAVLVRLYEITGDKKYLSYMDNEYWATTDYLYDKQDHLFYRDSRYFKQHTPSGAKVFWSRGNGWVYAGLARILEGLPKDWPTRPKYVQLFQEMTNALLLAQQPDGLWRPSLLDANAIPKGESSGTGLICYGLAWGVNNGILDEATCWPAACRAWNALHLKVGPDGKLGAIQQIGDAPKPVSDDSTEVYGVGAFLLAGSEIYKHRTP